MSANHFSIWHKAFMKSMIQHQGSSNSRGFIVAEVGEFPNADLDPRRGTQNGKKGFWDFRAFRGTPLKIICQMGKIEKWIPKILPSIKGDIKALSKIYASSWSGDLPINDLPVMWFPNSIWKGTLVRTNRIKYKDEQTRNKNEAQFVELHYHQKVLGYTFRLVTSSVLACSWWK